MIPETNELTLYDIMGEDLYVFARVHNNQVEVEVMDDRDVTVFKEISHVYAWESLVSFSRQVLQLHKRIEKALDNE